MSLRQDPATHNENIYDELVESIAASKKKMSLLIAVCDDSILRDSLIKRYEAELKLSGFSTYRLKLPRREPSLRAAIAQVVGEEPYLSKGGIAVLTVTGIEKLRYLQGLDGDRTEQDKFFGYLQWTREALPRFKYPIVIWLTNETKNKVIKYAPDFWSWRSGVLRFRSQMIKTNEDNRANFYAQMGKEYVNRMKRGQAADYKTEQSLALEYLQEAVALQGKSDPNIGLADSLNELANLYRDMGRYSKAEPLYLQALQLRKHLFGEDNPDVATSLDNMARLYHFQGRYAEAETLLKQALKLRKSLLGKEHPDVATSLNNLAGLYQAQKRYAEAEPLYLQAFKLTKRFMGSDHPDVATCLNNLAALYHLQGRYAKAENLHLQALELRKNLLGDEHPDVANSLNNLAGLYEFQERYEEAEPLYLQALELSNLLLGNKHPQTVTINENLAALRNKMAASKS